MQVAASFKKGMRITHVLAVSVAKWICYKVLPTTINTQILVRMQIGLSCPHLQHEC